MNKQDCSCHVEIRGEYNTEHQATELRQRLVYCPLHGAAPELLAALRNFGHSALSQSDYCAICGGDVTRNMHASGCAVLVAEAAIAKAEGTL